MSLTCYHAYSRCDTHGAVGRRQAVTLQLNRRAPISAKDHSNMIRNMPEAELRGYLVTLDY